MIQIATEGLQATSGRLGIGAANQPLRLLAHHGAKPAPDSGDPTGLWSMMLRARDLCQVIQDSNISDICAIAVPVRQGRKVVGALGFLRDDARNWTIEESRTLLAVAAQMGRVLGHLEDMRAHDEVARRLEGLVTAAEALISTDPLSEILKRMTTAVQDLLHIPQCSVMLVNERKELTMSVTGAGSASYAARPGVQPTGHRTGLYGDVNPKREPVPVLGLGRKPVDDGPSSAPSEALTPVRSHRKNTSPAQSASLHSVPIFFHGSVIGMLILYGISPGSLGDDDERLLAALSSLCGVAIGNAQRFERLLQTDHQLRLDDRLSTLGAVGAEIAHEIRNPINIISLLLHSLREERTLPPARERDLDIIIEKLQHMDRVVSRTLELARQREPQLEWIQVEEQLDNLLNFITHPAATQAVLIHRLNATGPLPPLLMDRTHLDQILLNLLLNALEAMPNGGILALRTYPILKRPSPDPQQPARRGRPRKDPNLQPSGLGITISDTGAGIPADRLRDIFTPFTSSRHQGTGLGLFVAHKLTTLHGGTIEAKSGAEGGTTFTIEFPLGSQPIQQTGDSA